MCGCPYQPVSRAGAPALLVFCKLICFYLLRACGQNPGVNPHLGRIFDQSLVLMASFSITNYNKQVNKYLEHRRTTARKRQDKVTECALWTAKIFSIVQYSSHLWQRGHGWGEEETVCLSVHYLSIYLSIFSINIIYTCNIYFYFSPSKDFFPQPFYAFTLQTLPTKCTRWKEVQKGTVIQNAKMKENCFLSSSSLSSHEGKNSVLGGGLKLQWKIWKRPFLMQNN
jgi:hypothetical protein